MFVSNSDYNRSIDSTTSTKESEFSTSASPSLKERNTTLDVPHCRSFSRQQLALGCWRQPFYQGGLGNVIFQCAKPKLIRLHHRASPIMRAISFVPATVHVLACLCKNPELGGHRADHSPTRPGGSCPRRGQATNGFSRTRCGKLPLRRYGPRFGFLTMWKHFFRATNTIDYVLIKTGSAFAFMILRLLGGLLTTGSTAVVLLLDDSDTGKSL